MFGRRFCRTSYVHTWPDLSPILPWSDHDSHKCQNMHQTQWELAELMETSEAQCNSCAMSRSCARSTQKPSKLCEAPCSRKPSWPGRAWRLPLAALIQLRGRHQASVQTFPPLKGDCTLLRAKQRYNQQSSPPPSPLPLLHSPKTCSCPTPWSQTHPLPPTPSSLQ